MLTGMALWTGLSRRAIPIATCALSAQIGAAMPAQAQSASQPSRGVLELGVHYGAPERLSGSVSGIFAYGRPSRHTGAPTKALAIRGGVGRGGMTFGIGHRVLGYGPFGPDATMTVTRTFSLPRQATARSTYLGLDVGLQLMGRATLGVARQVDGPSVRRDTVVTWSVGVQVPYGFWRW
jgi:hypothetical protein